MSAWEGTEYGEKMNEKWMKEGRHPSNKKEATPEQKETNTYLNNWLGGSERRTGRSTRTIDEMVQQLFSQGFTVVTDHAHRVDANGTPENVALSHTENIFFDRLYREHNLQINRDYSYDTKTKIVKLSK